MLFYPVRISRLGRGREVIRPIQQAEWKGRGKRVDGGGRVVNKTRRVIRFAIILVTLP